jgi:hypothetical protein
MKIWVMTAALFLFTSAAYANTSLYIPFSVKGYHENELTPVAQINPILVAKGIPAQIEFAEVSAQTRFDFIKYRADFDEVLWKAGLLSASSAEELSPSANNSVDQETCYHGEPDGVIKIVESLAGTHYSADLRILGWKLGSKVWLAPALGGDDSTLKAVSELWSKYNKNRNDVLLISSPFAEGDDGDEALISRCTF